MPIVFSAIVPHSPLFIPTIGKENLNQLAASVKAYKELEDNLYAANPESIIIISPHGLIQSDAFTMNLSPKFTVDFEEFGEFATKMEFEGDIGLAYKIRERMETRASLQLVTEERLDHGCGVPLYMIASNLRKIKLIPLYYSDLNLKTHYEFGQLIKRELVYNKDRVAIIASGDLSHTLTKNAPAGYSSKAAKFDQKIIECVKNKKNQDILRLDAKLIDEVKECGLKSISILLGMLDGLEYEPKILSYEYPFGVGYLVAGFKL